DLQAAAVAADAAATREVRAGAVARGSAVAVPCAAAGSPGAVLAGWLAGDRQPSPAEREALDTLGALTAVALANADLRAAERNFFTHATNLLVATLDRYLDDRSDHSRRVAALANQISHGLELSEARRERLHFAALLHDIGMLHIPRAHADDRVLARRHVELGDQMLRPIRVWEDLARFVRHHHERWDGGGYPDGLRGEQIPLESRIIAVAEAFDVMTSEKSYKEAISVAEALARLVDAAGAQFDPAVVEALVKARHEPA
ncbi:MAG: HD domain-containing protein, partial [Thermoanaerobaculia bacterium]|nr:HD domain-containing protein [Thermoanaerobaculia bacterium]